MRTLVLLASTTLASIGCSTVLVTHVHGTDYKTPGVRYWLPAPYLLVKTAVEINRVESLYSMSPIDKTVVRLVVPCEGGQTPCRSSVPVPPPVATAPAGAQAGRPGVNPSGGAQPAPEDSLAPGHDGTLADAGAADRLALDAGEREGGAAGTAIVWLPDYCQQYAILEKDHAGSQKVQIQLADGWKLNALNTEVNNTEVLQKMFDTISNLAGSMTAPSQRVATAGIQTATSALERGAQGGRTRLFRRTRITAFKPGLYPMLQYPLTKENQPDCTKLPSFRPPKDATQQSEFWSEVAAPREAEVTILAAPVDPGRPANAVRPPPH